MKKTIRFFTISCLFILIAFRVNAQASLSFSLETDSVGYGLQNSTIIDYGKLYNLTNSTIQYKVTRVVNEWPSAWGTPENVFCFDGSCYTPTTNSHIDTMPARDSTLFDTEWVTGNANDTAHVLMEFFNTTDSSVRVYQNFYAVTDSSSGIAILQITSDPIGIFPNPFINSTTLSVPAFLINNTSSLNFILYDETGRAVKSLPISRSGNLSLDRGNLPAGMYFYTFYNGQQGQSNLIQHGRLVIL